MSTSVEKLMSLKLGQPLLVETTGGELLAGTLKNINMKYLIVELDNVQDIKTNYTYQSSQILAYTQMKSIKKMINEDKDKVRLKSFNAKTDTNISVENLKGSESTFNSSSTTGIDNSFGSQENNDGFNIELSAIDFKLIQNQLKSMIFITQTDHNYHKAINDIKSQSVIGLLIDPIEMGRNCKTSLMAMSTYQNIYLFDMLALGKIFKEVRLILQAERPRKAIHFSQKIADHFKFRHSVILKGIFDTFLAYCVVKNEKNTLTLEETIQKTFGIPVAYFESDLGIEFPFKSNKRPIPLGQRMIYAKKVAFQLKLYDYLLHEYMLKNFYKQCELSCSRAGYEHIQPNGNWKE